MKPWNLAVCALLLLLPLTAAPAAAVRDPVEAMLASTQDFAEDAQDACPGFETDDGAHDAVWIVPGTVGIVNNPPFPAQVGVVVNPAGAGFPDGDRRYVGVSTHVDPCALIVFGFAFACDYGCRDDQLAAVVQAIVDLVGETVSEGPEALIHALEEFVGPVPA